MMFSLIVLTDGRLECLTTTIRSFQEHVGVNLFDEAIIVNDCLDPQYKRLLAEAFPDFKIIPPRNQKRGFGGAIRAAWKAVSPSSSYVFHLEDDFEFTRPVPIDDMADALDAHPHIQQFALRRQPWSDEEKAAGGIIEMWPDLYTDVTWRDSQWLEHDLFFTTNPSLYRASLIDVGWPEGDGSEAEFTRRILARDASNRFAYWGPRTDPPWVNHVGHQRIGTGY